MQGIAHHPATSARISDREKTKRRGSIQRKRKGGTPKLGAKGEVNDRGSVEPEVRESNPSPTHNQTDQIGKIRGKW